MQITKSTAWQNLKDHYQIMSALHLRELFAHDPQRFNSFSLSAPHIFLDYSKNPLNQETMKLLVALANAADLKTKINAMFNGEKINFTEHRAVLHTALRNRTNRAVNVDGVNVMPQINTVLEKMRVFSEQVRSGKWLGYTGKKITDVVNIGIGGSDLGPKMVVNALNAYRDKNIKAHFVSNVDGTQIVETLKYLDPATTLFCVASKTFTTIETLTNANTARDWLIKHLGDQKAVAKHFVAISTNTEAVRAFGIDTNNMFEFWDWVGGRYSVWSAIGLSIAITLGMDNFVALLQGAHEMDEHFRTSAFEQNLPVLLALIGIWQRNFFGFTSHAVIPYDQYLQYFPNYLQQLDMESNGKSVDCDGNKLNYASGPVIWGGIGTDGQHAFHQLLHQGTDPISVDFILPLTSLNPIGNHHELLFANCLAQAQALLQGKTLAQATKELLAKGLSSEDATKLAPHKVMPGNRPSNTLLLEKLTPTSLGALIALYEHKVFVQGIIWQINSFDQWGVELGKQLATKIVPALQGENIDDSYDSSTKGLINKYCKTK